MTRKDDTAQADDAAAPTGATPSVDAHLKEIVVLKEELNAFRDLAGRAQADLLNAKARGEREADDLRKYASESMIRKILPTLDNFQRAFQHVPSELATHEWVKGVSAIEADLMSQMTAAGLKRMQSVHQPVDASRHEILTAGPGPIDTVIEVFEEGYELNGKVLRPAKVKVGDGSEKA
jgi:molecular chaperone GrpE (heat shock protein)